MKIRRIHFLLILFVLCVVAFMGRDFVRRCLVASIQIMKGQKTVSQRVDEFGSAVRQRLAADFQRVDVEYPPEKITLIGLKKEKILEVWITDNGGDFVWLRSYPIIGASGRLGPKLQEGDYQVPEGLYRIESLNPNSRFHLSLRINYPNEFDLNMAVRDRRDHPGSDIMIHGSRSSIGCLAMGDTAAEDLFVLAAETGMDHIDVILSPVDFREGDYSGQIPEEPEWIAGLYEQIEAKLMQFQRK